MSDLGAQVVNSNQKDSDSTKQQNLVEPFVMPKENTIVQNASLDSKKYTNEKIYEKSTFASRMQCALAPYLSDKLKLEYEKTRHDKNEKTTPRISNTLSNHHHHRSNQEHISNLIANKREIFLVQMSLDTKRSEICKLEERAIQREEALNKSENMLEEDIAKFDAFLKENDEKVKDAMKKVDLETKLKRDRIDEIKKINLDIGEIHRELNKEQGVLDDCKMYKEFLDGITPVDWFRGQSEKKENKRQEILNNWKSRCEDIDLQKAKAYKSKEKAEYDYANARTQQEAEKAEEEIAKSIIKIKEANSLRLPTRPSTPESSEDDEFYFDQPQKLLNIYSKLEEENLFLMQNLQKSEEELEELKFEFKEKKENLNNEVINIENQINDIEGILKLENQNQEINKNENDKINIGFNICGNKNNIALFEDLENKVIEIYSKCGFEPDVSMNSVAMLTNIEARLKEHLSFVESLPNSYCESLERHCEKERRNVIRKIKMETQKLEHEARTQRALERAAAPAFKRIGKPPMTRSYLPEKKVICVKKDEKKKDLELEEFLTKDLLL